MVRANDRMTTCRYWSSEGGWHLAAILAEGRKHISLLDLGTLHVVRLPIADRWTLRPVPVPRTRLAKLLRRQRQRFKRLGIRHAEKRCKAFERTLR